MLSSALGAFAACSVRRQRGGAIGAHAFQPSGSKPSARAPARRTSPTPLTAGSWARSSPTLSVYELDRDQPEFQEEVWQYLNRRVSDWRIITGKERAREYAGVLERVEREYGVDRYIMAGLWGMELAYGDLITNPKHMRPIFPALAALAWGEPRRRSYWEQELLNALVIVEAGWGTPEEMIGSWAGAMGHTQWMPEVWLHMGVDFNRDGSISPFGPPDDALAGTARYLVERGNYRRGEGMGLRGARCRQASRQAGGMRTDRRAGKPRRHARRRQAFPAPAGASAACGSPVPGGPALPARPAISMPCTAYNPA